MAKNTAEETALAAIHEEASRVAQVAFDNAVPTPMHLVNADIFGRPLPNAEVYVVNEGVCGFASVHIKGNTPFGRYMKKNKLASPHWQSGLSVRPNTHSQSLTRKEAWAEAYAKVLTKHDISAYVESRLD